jgi:hypothetical protein
VKGISSIAAMCFFLYHCTHEDLYLEWIGSFSTPYSLRTAKSGWFPPRHTDLN